MRRLLLVAAIAVSLLVACVRKPPKKAKRPAAQNVPQIVFAMSQFKISFDKRGKKIYTPGDAKVWVLQPNMHWGRTELTDADSNVFHKALPHDVDGDGKQELVVIGGSKARIKFWRHRAGRWTKETIWAPDLLRVRDIEFGDVDGDGQEEFVVATHAHGGVYVFNKVKGKWVPTQIDGPTKERRYVHEIELGDVDGDGVVEIFATPSAPNVAVGIAQPGQVVMYKWDGKQYAKTVLEDMADTHSKEILVADLYGTGRPVLLIPIEGIGKKGKEGREELVTPCQVKEYRWEEGKAKARIIGEIPDFQVRTLWAGDADNDGDVDIVAGAKLAGLFMIERVAGHWETKLIDPDSHSAVHAVWVGDCDGDGKNEILSSSDADGRLDRYDFRDGKWQSNTIVMLPPGDWLWTIYQGQVLN